MTFDIFFASFLGSGLEFIRLSESCDGLFLELLASAGQNFLSSYVVSMKCVMFDLTRHLKHKIQ